MLVRVLMVILGLGKQVFGAGSVAAGTTLLMGAFVAASAAILSYRMLVSELVKLLPLRLNLVLTYFGFFAAVETLFAMIAAAYALRYTRFLLARAAKLLEKASS